MLGRRKKQPLVQRSPHLNQQQQTTFRYSSNRSQTGRTLSRQDPEAAGAEAKARNFSRLKSAPYMLGATVILLGATYLSLLLAPPQIIVHGEQAPLRKDAPYARLVSSMTNNLLSRSKLTINRQKITHELQTRFPELRIVKVTTPLFSSRAIVEIEVARPELVLNSGANSFLLDNRGVALLNSAQEQVLFTTDKIPSVSDQSNTGLETGKQALTSAQVAFILEVNRQSQAKNLKVDSMNLSAGAGELAVRYASIPYYVKYNLNEDARKSFGTFFATKEHIESTNVKPSEYIDVRIPERAYVK